MKKIGLIALALVGVGILLYGANLLMTEVIFGPPPAVRQALRSDASVRVESSHGNGWLVFIPQPAAPSAGLVMYPENYQDIRMYAPLCRQIAQAGFQVVLLSRRAKAPPTLAEEEQRVTDVMAAYPAVKDWFIGGHTWEAGVAAHYAILHPERLRGVVFWAGRLDASASLAQSRLPVLEIYGTADEEKTGVAARSRPFLPPQTVWVVIQGGNRVNFANFGPLPGDATAAIPLEEQQAQALSATVGFIRGVMGNQ